MSDHSQIGERNEDHTFFEMLGSSMLHLHGHDLESTLLETGEDLADEIALDAIRLDHDEAPFLGGHFVWFDSMKKVNVCEIGWMGGVEPRNWVLGGSDFYWPQ
jgi:hypothetical protein